MHDIVLILNRAGNENESFIQHYHSVLVIEIRADNHSCCSCLIFQRHKDHSLGCSRPLASNYTASNGSFLPVCKILEFNCGLDTSPAKVITTVRHWVRTSGHSCSVKI